MTLTLAIETSGPTGSIALARDGVCLEERLLELGRQHGQTLIPELRDLLACHGVTPRDCRLIAVSVGPGSFTGLRVGIVCAKTLGYATGATIVAVDTFLAIACNAPADVQRLHVIADAQREDVFAGEFHRTSDHTWEACGKVRLMDAAGYAAALPPGVVVTGPGVEKLSRFRPQDASRREFRGLPQEYWRPTATAVAEIGKALAARGKFTDAWTLEPFYLRKSAAEEKWEQKQAAKATPDARGIP